MGILKTVIMLLITMIGYSGFSQSDLNQFKYIIVPKKFESFKNENEYKTSTLIKYLLAEKGFNVVYDDALPNDLNSNRCLGLKASLLEESNLFTTKTTVVFKDCNGKEVFQTMQGTSKEKEFRAAYSEAIKKAMQSFNGIDYAYSAKSEGQAPITVSFKNDIKKLKEEKSGEKESDASKKKGEPTEPNAAVTQIATEKTQYYKEVTPVDSDIQKNPMDQLTAQSLNIKKSEIDDIWYAQVTSTGYQLVDHTPTIRMRLFSSSIDSVFMAQTDALHGLVYQKDGNWVFEYYDKEQRVQQTLHIKF